MPLLDREEGLRRYLAQRGEEALVAPKPVAPLPSPLRSGIENVKATGHGLRAQFHAETGDDAAAESALQDAAAASERAAAIAPRIQSYDQVKSPADALNYVEGLVGTQLPNLAVTAAGALVGRKVLGPKVGALAGGTAAGTGLESGQIFQEIAADPEARKDHSLRDLSRTAAGFGLGAGAIDALPVARVFDRFGVGKAGREAIRDGLFKRAAKGASINAATEGATEGIQTAIERSAHKFVNNNFEVFGEEGVREILNATAGGAALGGLLGPLEGLAAPRGSIEERMAKLEADDELGAAFGKASADLEGIVSNESRDIDAPDDISTRARIARARAAGKFDAMKDSSRGPASIIRSHAKQEHLGELDEPTLDVITKLATGEAELTPQVRELLEPRFHYFNDMIDQVRGRFGLRPENVQVEGTQSGINLATGEQAAELTKPVVGEDGQAARDERGNLVRPTETQIGAHAKFRFKDDNLGGAATLGLARAVHGQELPNTSTERDLQRLREDDPNTEYKLVPLDEAVSKELTERGLGPEEVSAELAQRGQQRFEQAMAKLTDTEKQARLQSTFDPQNPAAFLKNFEVIHEQSLPDAVQQGDEDVLTHEDLKANPGARRKAVFEGKGKDGKLYDGRFLVQDGETQRTVVASRLVGRMLQKQGVKDLDNPTLAQIASAYAGGIHALSKRGMKVSKTLPDSATVAYSGGKRVLFSDIKNVGQGRLEARAKGLREQQTRVGAQMQAQDTLIRSGRVKEGEGVAKINELGRIENRIGAQQQQTEAQLAEAKALRTLAQELEQNIKAAEQALVRDLHLLPKTAARIEKALGDRNRAGLFTRLHEARDAIEEKGHVKAAKVMMEFLNAARASYTRLDNIAKQLDRLGVVHTSPRLEGFRDGNAAFAAEKREEEKGQEKATVTRDERGNVQDITTESITGELHNKKRTHVTSDTKLAQARKLVARRNAVESVIGEVAYTEGTFGEALEAAGKAMGPAAVAEIKGAKIDTRDKLVAWLERQRIEAGTVLGLIDSTEGRFDQDGVDPIVGNESRTLSTRAEKRQMILDVVKQLPDKGMGGHFEDAIKEILPTNKDPHDLFELIVLNIEVDGQFVRDWLDAQTEELTGAEVGKKILDGFDAMPDETIQAEEFNAWPKEFSPEIVGRYSRMQGTVDDWSKALGIPKVRVVPANEIEQFLYDTQGPFKALETMDELQSERGLHGEYLPGANTILVNPFKSEGLSMEVLAHEFGHAIFTNELIARFTSEKPADRQMAEAILKDFLEWRSKYGRPESTVKGIFASKKAFLTQIGLLEDPEAGPKLKDLGKADAQYVLDFNEWFADQVSRALTREGEARNVVEGFFDALIAKIKEFVEFIKLGGKGVLLPARSVAEFLQAMYRERRLSAMEMKSRPTEAALMEALYKQFAKAQDRGHGGRARLYDYLNKAVKQADHNRRMFRNLSKEGIEGHQSRESVSAGASQQHAPFSEQTRLKVKRSITNWLKPEERRALGRAFSSPHVMRQLRAALRAFPVILDKVERDPLEALSYGYQLWMAGQIDLGPKTQNLFQTFHDFIEELFGLVSEGKEAENVLRALSKNLDAGARDPLLNILEGPTKTGRLNRVARFTNDTYKDVHHLFGKMFYTASSRMYHTGNPVLRQLADLVQPRTGGEGAKQGMLEARRERIARFLVQRAKLFEGLENDAELKAEVLRLLQNPKVSSKNQKAVELRDGMRKLLRDVFAYTKSKGVDIGDLGTDYFPWVFDPKAMIDNAAEFTAMLSQPKYAANIAELAKEWDVDPKDVPGMIAEQIAEAGGVADSHLTAAGALKRTPYMASLNPRNLDWIRTLGDEKDMTTLAKLLSKDLDGTVINYVHQAVKRGEFVARFGEKGEKLESMFKQAKELGASDDDLKLAEHYMAAVTGTLGTGTNQRLAALFGGKHAPGQVINPALRLGMSALMVAQNVAILGLATFTSLADPVGIMVRGGSLSEGLEALKAGAKEIMAAAKGEQTDLKSLAEALGAIEDSATTEALEWEYGSTYLTPGLKWTNEMFFRTIGLTQWTRITRLMALAGARKFLEKHADGTFNKHSKRYLEQLGLTIGDVEVVNGELKVANRLEREQMSNEERARDDRVRSALNRFVDESILRPNATQRPIWASDPHWMLVWHLKSFTYSFYETILKRVVNELGERNAAPALMLSLFVPAMLASDLLRELFTEGEVDDDKDIGERLVFATERSGLTGLTQFLLDAQQDRKYGGVGIESFAGPTAAMIGRVPSLFADDSDQRWAAFQKNLPYQNVWKHWLAEGSGATG